MFPNVIQLQVKISKADLVSLESVLLLYNKRVKEQFWQNKKPFFPLQLQYIFLKALGLKH